MYPKCKTYNRKKILIVFLACFLMMAGLTARLVQLMIFESEYYQELAKDLHERERSIKAARGKIVDSSGTVLATNRTVCTISVIHSQIEDPETVIRVLSDELKMDEADVRERVEKVSSMEKIKTNVEKDTGDKIREYDLAGVKVDEDYKRYYPYDELASRVLGFTGGDNQGIIGLEVKYEDYLKGQDGTILTVTDARGVELDGVAEDRIEPVPGETLRVSLDYNIQSYCQQAAEKVMEEKQAEAVSILLMNPQNGEIYAMVNVPEFNLNEPYELNTGADEAALSDEDLQDELNSRNFTRSNSDTTLLVALGAIWHPSDQMTLRVLYDRDYVSSAVRNIVYNSIRLGVDWKPRDTWNLSGSTRYWSYDDDNAMFSGIFEAFWEWDPDLGVWLGLSASTYTTSDPSDWYWTPYWDQRIMGVIRYTQQWAGYNFRLDFLGGFHREDGRPDRAYENDVTVEKTVTVDGVANTVTEDTTGWYVLEDQGTGWELCWGVQGYYEQRLNEYFTLILEGNITALREYIDHSLVAWLRASF